MRTSTKRISFNLTPDLLDRVGAEATKRRVRPSELMRTAVIHYLAYLEEERLYWEARNRSFISLPVINLNTSEADYADTLMKEFREEDRHNLP